MSQLNLLIIFILVIATGVGDCSAQAKSRILSNGEIGINTFQFSDLTRYDFYGSIDGEFSANWGVVYKAKIKQNVRLRTYASYFYKFNHYFNTTRIDDGAWDFEKEEQYLALALGLERQMFKGRVSSYIFSDIYQQFGQRKKNGWVASIAGPMKLNDTYNFNQIGIASGVGVKFSINQHLCLNLESHTRFVREFKPSEFYTFRREKYQAYFNPISRLSLNYRF